MFLYCLILQSKYSSKRSRVTQTLEPLRRAQDTWSLKPWKTHTQTHNKSHQWQHFHEATTSTIKPTKVGRAEGKLGTQHNCSHPTTNKQWKSQTSQSVSMVIKPKHNNENLHPERKMFGKESESQKLGTKCSIGFQVTQANDRHWEKKDHHRSREEFKYMYKKEEKEPSSLDYMDDKVYNKMVSYGRTKCETLTKLGTPRQVNPSMGRDMLELQPRCDFFQSSLIS